MNKATIVTLLLTASAMLAPGAAADDAQIPIPAVCDQMQVEECQDLVDAIGEIVATGVTRYWVEYGSDGSDDLECTYTTVQNISIVLEVHHNWVAVGYTDDASPPQDHYIHKQYYDPYDYRIDAGNTC